MKRLVLGTAVPAILSGIALGTAGEAAPYGRRYGNFTPHERAAIVRSRRHCSRLASAHLMR